MSKDKNMSGRKRPRSGRSDSGMLKKPLPAIEDPEGDRVPAFLPPVVDAHVHLFPDNLFAAIWHWFDDFGWPIRYKMTSPEAIRFLLSRGIERIVGLHYAHKPGIAHKLNSYMAKLCRTNSRLTGLATVMPGEENAGGILEEAFRMGLAGVKLHAHVQCIDVNSPAMHEVYQSCTEFNKPLLIHAGREPSSPGYRCDPHLLCSAEKLERVIKAYPDLRICVPHLGADEFESYQQMLEQHDNLWLDTTMTLARYLPMDFFPDLTELRADRIIFGTDFPNLPYAWDREIRALIAQNLPDAVLERILGKNAMEF